MLKQGEKLWNGATVSGGLAAAYNSIQARIASFEAAGKPAPDYLLNGAHNLIAGAMPDEPEAINHLRRLDVPSMTRGAVYDMREGIAALIIHARADYRELQAQSDCRAIAWRQRDYVESVADRLASVLRP